MEDAGPAEARGVGCFAPEGACLDLGNPQKLWQRSSFPLIGGIWTCGIGGSDLARCGGNSDLLLSFLNRFADKHKVVFL